MHLFLLAFSLLLFKVLRTQEIVTINSTNKIYNLALHSQFVEDPNGVLQWQNLNDSQTKIQFQRIQKQVVNFGITASVFWIKATVRNEIGKDITLKVGNNALSDVQVFELIDNKLASHYHSGGWLPFAKRQIKDVDFLFPLHVPIGKEATVILRVQHTRGTQFPFQAGTITAFYNEVGLQNVLQGIYFGFMLVMLLYNLFVYFSLKDSSYLYYVNYVFMMGIFNAVITGYAYQYLWPSWPFSNQYVDILATMVCMSGIVFTVSFLHTKRNTPFLHKVLWALFAFYLGIAVTLASGYFLEGSIALEYTSLVLVIIFFVTAYAVLRKGYRPAVFFLLAWSFLLLSVVAYVLKDLNILPNNAFTESALQIGSAIEALLLSMALANRINVYKKEKLAAQLEAFRSLEENKKLITEQNLILEKKIEERTGELKTANAELVAALTKLQTTQAQLIHREKMASLGELTTGIAHEIQNPLNFVTNFSAINLEMLDELRHAARLGNLQEILSIAEEVKANGHIILSHGHRIDGIVKTMFSHALVSNSEKLPTNINALAEEYLRLSYHRMRAKYKTFDVVCKTTFDHEIGEIVIAPQDIGQVLLNVYSNAFHAVQEKKKQLNGNYMPLVEVMTLKKEFNLEIQVNDNGTGIPQKLVNKIFQPFFTTKPTGEGTGLGLSLSYDIITKGYDGELWVESIEGEGARFFISLPL